MADQSWTENGMYSTEGRERFRSPSSILLFRAAALQDGLGTSYHGLLRTTHTYLARCLDSDSH